MASHDAGWEAFRHELRHWMELRRMTSKALATHLNQLDPDASFDEHVVKRWRHSTAPPLASIRDISSILRMSDDPSGHAPHDPTFLLRRMELLSADAPADQLLDTAHRLQSLRLQLQEVRASLGELSARSGAGQLVQTALSHGYAAAVYPVWEGPIGYPMHVSDRIDFRHPRPDQPPIEDHADMQAALVANFAVPGMRTPRFSTSEGDLALQSHWAIPLIGRPFSRSGKAAHLSVPAVAVSSATTTAWPDDVASILASLLGYGFVSTREVARELTHSPLATEPLRGAVHDQFMTNPPQHHVWSHHSTSVTPGNDHAPWAAPDGTFAPGLVHIRLAENDEVLASTTPFGRTDVDAGEALAHARTTAQEVERRLQDPGLALARTRTLVIPTPLVTAASDRWECALKAVLAATHHLVDLGVTRSPHLDAVHDRFVRDEPDIAPTLLRWLADHECPLISTKFASVSTTVSGEE